MLEGHWKISIEETGETHENDQKEILENIILGYVLIIPTYFCGSIQMRY